MATYTVYRRMIVDGSDGKPIEKRRTDSGPGTWYIDYSDEWGRRHREATKATTRREAEALVREKLSAIVKAKIIGVNNPEALSITFEKFVNEIFLPHAKGSRRASTYRKYVEYARMDMPIFGKMNLRAIQQGDVQRHLDHLATEGRTHWGHPMKPATVNRRREFLRCVFYEALRRRYVSENPCVGTRKLREDNERTRYASEWEEGRIMEAAEPWLPPILKLATLAGLRLGEIVSLRWDQIDQARGAIRIPPTSKGHKGREVPITPDLWPWLRGIAPYVGPAGRSPFVFTNPATGKPHHDHGVENAWKRALRQANAALAHAAEVVGTKDAPRIEDLHLHDLRRTFASRLAQKGVSLQTIADLLGHSAVYVTMRYAYLQPENLRAAVALLSKGGLGPNPAQREEREVARRAVVG